MQTIEPSSENRVRTTGCIECDPGAEVITDNPVEFLLARRARPSLRIVTVDGIEVHRCTSPFLMSAF